MLGEQLENFGKLKTGLLGLSRAAEDIIRTAAETQLFELVSIADSDISKLQRPADFYKCTAFDDYRQFILQNNFEVLLVAEPLYKCLEYVKAAIAKKCHIIKLAPTAANFEQAAELISLAEKHKVRYITARPLRFAPGYERLVDYLKTVDLKDFYFLNICATFSKDFFEPIAGEKDADAKLFGGGVLISRCFELLSLIVETFSLPQQIYALTTNKSSDKKARLYFGEDTVSASLIFKESLIAAFSAAEQNGLASVAPLRLYGTQQNISVTPNRLAVYDNDGTLVKENKYPLNSQKCITEMLINIGRALLDSESYKLTGSHQLDLATMAFIQAAYLSSRTSMPETPQKFMEILDRNESWNLF